MSLSARALLVCSAILFCLGLMMVFNTTSAEIIDRAAGESTSLSLIKQIVYGGIGILAGIYLLQIDAQSLIRASNLFYVLSVIMLILVFLPVVGQQINGAHRWIGVGSFTFQPSEFVKIVLPLFTINAFQNREKPLLFKHFITILALLFLPIVLILFEPDNGTAGVLIATLIMMLYLMKVRWVYWALPLMVFMSFGAFFASKMKHVVDRIQVYLNPELDLLGKGHQPYQAKIAAGSGGLFGRGFGESLQKMSYLPEARSDYIAAIYAEEFGFLGMLFLLLLYMAIGYFGFRIATQAKTRHGFYLATTLSFLLTFQAFLNLGVVSGLLPSKGTNLPLFSHGGSSLVMNLISIFLIVRVGCHEKENRICRRWHWWPRLSRH